MDSFVDKFKDKKISIETLYQMLLVDYQRSIFIDMFIDKYKDHFEITKMNKFYLKLVSDENCIFVLLSKDEETLEEIKKQISYYKIDKEIFTIKFDKNKILDKVYNPVYIKPKKWMNRIISNGINRQILHLQFLRDLEFSYE
ncbi:hypothetical protein BFP78_12215 [Gaetbulibacter sp. 5U11]|nr:hypothetical protein BFP78_12215 [Gaetbulibacter sp. 5U11]